MVRYVSAWYTFEGGWIYGEMKKSFLCAERKEKFHCIDQPDCFNGIIRCTYPPD